MTAFLGSFLLYAFFFFTSAVEFFHYVMIWGFDLLVKWKK